MTKHLCHDLLLNYHAAIELVTESIGQFDNEQWVRGVDPFQVPCKIAYHIVECLDYYFRDSPEAPFAWGYRFDGGWWELPDEAQPTQGDLLAYVSEIRLRISRHLIALDDEDLFSPFDEQQEHGETRLGHYVYALRHTMHHHGALSLLSLSYGNPSGTWK